MDSSEDKFGSPVRVREYKILLYVGLGMIVVGFPLFFFVDIWLIIGIVLAFIGLMCVASGILGLREEKKKSGLIIKSTKKGVFSFLLGLSSVILSNTAYLSLFLGPIAIFFSYKSVKEGDNLYGTAGGICGAIGFIVNLYVLVLYTFFT